MWSFGIAPPMRLAEDAHRLAVCPAWQVRSGAVAALRHVASVDEAVLRRYGTAFADRLVDVLGWDLQKQAIVRLPDAWGTAFDLLRLVGTTASDRAGRLPLAFQHRIGASDVDAVGRVLAR